MSAVYFWKDSKVVIVEGAVGLEDARLRGLLRKLCVDTNTDAVAMRYGFYSSTGWAPHPFEVFPKEFRTHLLLLGVP